MSVSAGGTKDRREEAEIQRDGGAEKKKTQLECNLQQDWGRCTGIDQTAETQSCICVALSPLSGDNKIEDTYTVHVTLMGAGPTAPAWAGWGSQPGGAP